MSPINATALPVTVGRSARPTLTTANRIHARTLASAWTATTTSPAGAPRGTKGKSAKRRWINALRSRVRTTQRAQRNLTTTLVHVLLDLRERCVLFYACCLLLVACCLLLAACCLLLVACCLLLVGCCLLLVACLLLVVACCLVSVAPLPLFLYPPPFHPHSTNGGDSPVFDIHQQQPV